MCLVMPAGKADNFTYRAEGAGLAVTAQRRDPWSAVKSRYIYENTRSIVQQRSKKQIKFQDLLRKEQNWKHCYALV